MVEIRNTEELEGWLTKRAVEDAAVISTLAAMRVLPLIAETLTSNVETPTSAIALPVFRAISLSRTAIARPTPVSGFVRNARATAASRAARAARTANRVKATKAGTAAMSARGAAASIAPVTIPRAIEAAASAASTSPDIWNELTLDARALSDGILPSAISTRRLWQEATPDFIMDSWTLLKGALLEAPNESWAYWVDWYEARLFGDPPNEDLELSISMIPNPVWHQGPMVTNSKIRELIEEHET